LQAIRLCFDCGKGEEKEGEREGKEKRKKYLLYLNN
jgi:hypothetical protein